VGTRNALILEQTTITAFATDLITRYRIVCLQNHLCSRRHFEKLTVKSNVKQQNQRSWLRVLLSSVLAGQ